MLGRLQLNVTSSQTTQVDSSAASWACADVRPGTEVKLASGVVGSCEWTSICNASVSTWNHRRVGFTAANCLGPLIYEERQATIHTASIQGYDLVIHPSLRLRLESSSEPERLIVPVAAIAMPDAFMGQEYPNAPAMIYLDVEEDSQARSPALLATVVPGEGQEATIVSHPLLLPSASSGTSSDTNVKITKGTWRMGSDPAASVDDVKQPQHASLGSPVYAEEPDGVLKQVAVVTQEGVRTGGITVVSIVARENSWVQRMLRKVVDLIPPGLGRQVIALSDRR
ncbi:MAG: hypothetical protein ACPGUV_14790 [Polyangiales bacterium]